MDRRTFLTTVTGLGGSILAGCMGVSAPQNTSGVSDVSQSTTAGSTASIEEWISQMNNYTGVTDRTGEQSVTIDVGAEAENGTYFAFGPAAVKVSPGTTVTWRWLGKGGSHNVHAVGGADFESKTTTTEGYKFKRTFESEQTVRYQCDPHTSIGMKGVIQIRKETP